MSPETHKNRLLRFLGITEEQLWSEKQLQSNVASANVPSGGLLWRDLLRRSRKELMAEEVVHILYVICTAIMSILFFAVLFLPSDGNLGGKLFMGGLSLILLSASIFAARSALQLFFYLFIFKRDISVELQKIEDSRYNLGSKGLNLTGSNR